MKKSELKNIIKECVKEVIFEEGVLSGIITEVAQGLHGASLVQESSAGHKAFTKPPPTPQAAEAKKQILSAIGNSGYEAVKEKFKNPSLFEGTSPIPENKGTSALAGIAPTDPGIDISSLPGSHNWGQVVKKII